MYKRQLTELENKKEAIQERYAIEGLQRDLYEKFLTKLDTQKRQYLTSKINALFSAEQAFKRLSDEAKKIPTKNGEDSQVVAGTGFEPVAFGL